MCIRASLARRSFDKMQGNIQGSNLDANKKKKKKKKSVLTMPAKSSATSGMKRPTEEGQASPSKKIKHLEGLAAPAPIQKCTGATDRKKLQEKKKKKKQQTSEESTNDTPALDLSAGAALSTLEGAVCEATLQGIQDMGLTHLTEIQAKVIPAALQGKDLMGVACTGSGKTLAFLIPVIEMISKCQPQSGVGCIIISPTRESSIQTFELLKELTAHHTDVKTGLVIGGNNRNMEVKTLTSGANIVVATPGRILDHLENTPHFISTNLQVLVIDEAHRILECGFESDMKAIIEKLPKKHQSLLFSSTQTDKVTELANLTLRKPVCVHEDGQKSAATPAAGVEQGYVVIESERRFLLLYSFLKRMVKKKVIVFMSSALTGKYFSHLLHYLKIDNTCMHSQLAQKVRTDTIQKFKSCDQGVLLCTEVAARELDDIPNVDWLLQYDPPEDTKEYIERLGRLSEGGKAKSMLFLRPVEVPFLEVLREGQVTPNLMEFSNSQILNIQDKVEKLVGSQHALALAAREGYRGYLLAYASHSQKEIFNVKTLELKKVALSFGFTPPPFVDLEGVTGGKKTTGGARKSYKKITA